LTAVIFLVVKIRHFASLQISSKLVKGAFWNFFILMQHFEEENYEIVKFFFGEFGQISSFLLLIN
jgi:hypothetical protein